jgi:hypothetical protein
MGRQLMISRCKNASITGFWLPLIVIFCSLLLSSYWVYLIPMLQAPDEEHHADYVFTLFTKGRLIRAKEAPLVGCSHPFVRHLITATNEMAVKNSTYIKMPEYYGTPQFFNYIDHNVPNKDACERTATNPFVVAMYPFLYYALTAIYLSLLSHINNNLSFLFFAARFLSVILLGCGLTLAYLIMRELKLSNIKSLLLLAAIGFFPMVTMVGSYIQPDNLTFVAVNACLFFALRWRNIMSQRPMISYTIHKDRVLWWLAASIAVLSLTKYQFFWCTGIALVAMVVAVAIRSKIPVKSVAAILFLLFSPAMIVNLPQLWIFWHCHLPVLEHHWFPDDAEFRSSFKLGWQPFIEHIRQAFCNEYQSIYWVDGSAFNGFWGKFGWNMSDVPLVIFSPALNNALRIFIALVTNIILLFTLAGLVKIILILCRLLKQNHIKNALYIAFSNPVMNSYFLLVIFFLLLKIMAYPYFFEQGRHWFPLIVAVLLSATCFAPRLFTRRLLREKLFYLIIGSWLCYSIVGSYYSIGCVHKRYYESETDSQINIGQLIPVKSYAACHIDSCDFLDQFTSFESHPNQLMIPKNAYFIVRGWAFDGAANAPASGVVLYVDNEKMYQPKYGARRDFIAELFHNSNCLFSGFDAFIPTKDLPPGWHSVSMKVVSHDKKLLYDTAVNIKFFLLDH